jgi:DNA mismatch repair protein MutL
MPDIIQLLPDSIANQIAAGEVVQRPASVVKELMENAIDAGATHIRLVVRDAGKAFIQVVDNGSGMSDTDTRMSIERHATSKIRRAEDLFTIRTMGFRGEALASIAAVSQMEIRSRREAHELGTLLVVEGSEVKRQEPVAADPGTAITVKNLFFNIPARRNFLKSHAAEMQHVHNEFVRLALAHPGKNFQFINHDEIVFDLNPGKLSQRIVQLFGKNYQHLLAPCREETQLVRLSGYVGRPEAARKRKDEQFLFVNNRFIRSHSLSFAVRDAFASLIAPETHPFFVLFLDIDPRHIDVNVHPTKTEIKFDDERAVYAVVSAAVRRALGAHNLVPPIDFAADVNLMAKIENTPVSREQYLREQFGSAPRTQAPHWQKLFDEPPDRIAPPDLPMPARRDRPDAVPQNEHQPTLREGGVLGFRNRYIFYGRADGVCIIDQQAAHERILFEKFVRRLRRRQAAGQQLMFPVTVTFSAADFAMILELEKELTALGFGMEVFGKETMLITAVPAGVQGNESSLLEDLLEQFKRSQQQLSLPLNEKLAAALARRSSLAAGHALSDEEMRQIGAALFACTTPAFTPDGRPTFFLLETAAIERYLSR